MPPSTSDPAPDERRRLIAKILATGLLRFHRRVHQPVSVIQDSANKGLADAEEIRLMALTGAAGEGRERTGERQKP